MSLFAFKSCGSEQIIINIRSASSSSMHLAAKAIFY
jgi:hypothetical protein